MDIRERIQVDVNPAVLFPVLADLNEYPHWLSIVSRVREAADSGNPSPQLEPADYGSSRPAWVVDLQGSLGPLRRSKRLRMVRSECVDAERIVFERAELDGKKHSPWVLTVEIAPHEVPNSNREISTVSVHLHYGGNLWVPLLDRILEDEIRSSSSRLTQLINTRTT